jgi:phospholipid/cholesterol/gamma-HCH transport system substrate-binding protein
MLTALDRLGTVGTKVITASKDDVLKSLDHLQPILSNLSAAGDDLAPGLNLLISFPFPQEASEIVRGDYANTSIKADISLDNILPPGVTLPQIPLPDIPLPDLPNPGVVLNDVKLCLQSADIASAACAKVLADVDLLTQLKEKCTKDKYAGNPVCQVLGTLPDVPLDDLPDVLGGLLGTVLPRSLASSLSSGKTVDSGSTRSLVGGSS